MTEQKIVKIAICDDEVEMASDIEERILNLQEKYSVRVEIDVFYDGSTLTEYIAIIMILYIWILKWKTRMVLLLRERSECLIKVY